MTSTSSKITTVSPKVSVAPTDKWTDIWEGQHARAFVIAGAKNEAMLADFHEAVTWAIDEGRTLRDFREDFDTIKGRYGWKHTGGAGWRAKTIYDTNVRMAHAAGRWDQIKRNAATRPYLRYVAIDDDLTRPVHRSWHDTVLPVDHPFWETHYPPNGWNCRCIVQQMSQRDLDRLGLQVTTEAELEERGAYEKVKQPVGRDGPEIDVSKGIDTGFDYNVGIASAGRANQRSIIAEDDLFTDFPLPRGAEQDRSKLPVIEAKAQPFEALSNPTEEQLRSRLRDAIGSDETILADPTGVRVVVGQGIVDHMIMKPGRLDGRDRYFPLIPEVVQDPQEIWVAFATNDRTGKVALRRRYVRYVQLGKNQVLGLVMQATRGYWSGLTFFRGKGSAADRLRLGTRIYRKD